MMSIFRQLATFASSYVYELRLRLRPGGKFPAAIGSAGGVPRITTRYPIMSIAILPSLQQAHYPIRNTILQSLCKAQFSHKVCMTILQYPWCPFELIILRGELMTNFCLRGRKIVALLILYNSINLA